MCFFCCLAAVRRQKEGGSVPDHHSSHNGKKSVQSRYKHGLFPNSRVLLLMLLITTITIIDKSLLILLFTDPFGPINPFPRVYIISFKLTALYDGYSKKLSLQSCGLPLDSSTSVPKSMVCHLRNVIESRPKREIIKDSRLKDHLPNYPLIPTSIKQYPTLYISNEVHYPIPRCSRFCCRCIPYGPRRVSCYYQ